MSQLTLDVAFGIEPDGGILAVMPGVAAIAGRVDQVACYSSAEQHGSADLSYCVKNLTQADSDESAELLDELRRIGYDIRVIPLKSIGGNDYTVARRKQLGR